MANQIHIFTEFKNSRVFEELNKRYADSELSQILLDKNENSDSIIIEFHDQGLLTINYMPGALTAVESSLEKKNVILAVDGKDSRHKASRGAVQGIKNTFSVDKRKCGMSFRPLTDESLENALTPATSMRFQYARMSWWTESRLELYFRNGNSGLKTIDFRLDLDSEQNATYEGKPLKRIPQNWTVQTQLNEISDIPLGTGAVKMYGANLTWDEVALIEKKMPQAMDWLKKDAIGMYK